MHRRRYLAVLGSAAAGGCVGSETPDREQLSRGVASFAERGHPYANEVLVVSLDARVEPQGDVTAAIETATAYWQRSAPRYADFPVSYTFDPDAESPDIEVRTVEMLEHCGDHDSETIAGCAPQVTTETLRPETATIRIEAELREPFLTRILKHEFGHTLGLDHERQPQRIMSADPADWVPQYDSRRTIANRYVAAVEHHNAAVEAYNNGTTAFNREAYQLAANRYESSLEAVESTSDLLARAIETAREIDAADIVGRCRESKRTIDHLGTSAELLVQSATAYDEGDVVDGKRYQQDHEDPYERFRAGTFHPASSVLEQLGVPAEP